MLEVFWSDLCVFFSKHICRRWNKGFLRKNAKFQYLAKLPSRNLISEKGCKKYSHRHKKKNLISSMHNCFSNFKIWFLRLGFQSWELVYSRACEYRACDHIENTESLETNFHYRERFQFDGIFCLQTGQLGEKSSTHAHERSHVQDHLKITLFWVCWQATLYEKFHATCNNGNKHSHVLCLSWRNACAYSKG